MHAWEKIENWLKVNASNVFLALQPGVDKQVIRDVEIELGIEFTDAERQSLTRHNGQNTAGPPFIEDWTLLPLEEMKAQRALMTKIGERAKSADAVIEADQGIEKRWYHEKWLPFAHDGAGNLLCLDHASTDAGANGQLIEVRSDSARRSLTAKTIGEWLDLVAVKLANGEYEYRDGQIRPKHG